MNPRYIKLIVILILVTVIIIAGYSYFKKNIGSVNLPPKEIPPEQTGNEITYLKIPEGFRISIFAKDLPGARALEFDNKGNLLVSQTKEGKIAIIDNAGQNKILAEGLSNPHGILVVCKESCKLYLAESNAVSVYDYNSDTQTLNNQTKLADIASSVTDRHFTRSLLMLDDEAGNPSKLLISVGSSCNVCIEKDEQRGRILAYNFKTKKLETYATGLRNAVFMARDYLFGKIYATEMGRDGLGDDIPPDEINIIEEGKNYGWPICYGKNIHDTEFDKNTYIRNPCMEPFETPSFIDLPAHSAPLGLAFVPEEGWPEEYWHNMLVAYHGSWNRSEPTGYKISRLKINTKGEYLGQEDFISGWLTKDGKKIGRPVDMKIFPGGTLYISDDFQGVVYKMERVSE